MESEHFGELTPSQSGNEERKGSIEFDSLHAINKPLGLTTPKPPIVVNG